jgi:hypothetical protein
LLASPALSGHTIDVVQASRGLSHHLSGDPGYRATTCFGIVHLHRPNELTSSAPCRARRLVPERTPRQDQDPFRVRRANAVHCLSPGRLPPPSPVQPAPHLRTRRDLPGRHWYPGFATEGPASDTLSRPVKPFARPNDLPGYSPEPPSHVPPVDFCN